MLARVPVKIRRWLPIIAFAAFGAGAIACAVDGDLNPQPLPPGPDDSKSSGSGGGGSSEETSSSGFATGGGASGNSSSSGGSSSGDLGATPTDSSDAGATYDAGDADASK